MSRLNITPERVMMVTLFHKGAKAKDIGKVFGKSTGYVYQLNSDPKFRKLAKVGA